MDIILPEIVAAGVYNTGIAARGKTVTKKRKTTMFEIEIPVDFGGVSSIDNEKRPIIKDMVICAKPGQLRFTRVPYECYYIHMIVNEGALYRMLMDIPDFVTEIKNEKYINIFKRIAE